MQEDWKPISGYEGLYEVSTHGRIKSYHKSEYGEVIRPAMGCGSKNYANRIYRVRYLVIDLWSHQSSMNPFASSRRGHGRRRQYTVHRLVAQTFLEFDLFKTDIDHIDSVMTHNCLTNLEFVTRSENILRRNSTRLILQKAGMSSGPICSLCPTCGYFYFGESRSTCPSTCLLF